MPIPTRAELKAFFETGDQPTQAQFAELIDAIYDLVQGAQDTADAAETAAAAAVAAVKVPVKAFIRFKCLTTVSPGPYHQTYRNHGITLASVQLTGASALYTFTFDDAEADVNYTVEVPEFTTALPAITKTINGFTVTIPDTLNNKIYGILILV